jgi:hypothetical protein
LPAAAPRFDELLAAVPFDDVAKGRRGTVLVKPDARGVPIVRTTTPYPTPARTFRDLHDRLAEEIRASGALPHPFNNALVEHYTRAYTSMKRHSDQALDLAAGSSIAVYSAYRDPVRPSRHLRVTPKGPGDGAAFEVLLEHGSVVVFSLDTNRRFTHTIALGSGAPDNDWLGITFRTSATFVRFVDGQPTVAGLTRLTLAGEDERRDFFALRRRENDETDFTYPPIAYTISESDLVPPIT